MHYNSYTKLTRDIKEICQQKNFDCFEVGRVGKNKQYPLLRVVIEPPEFSKTLLILSGVHSGTEPAPVTAVVEFLREYEDDCPVKLIMFPCLNPYAVSEGTRKNWENKDLNRSRNYYFQPEQTLCLLHSYGQSIDAVISLHEDSRISGKCCYGYGFNRQYKSFYQGLLGAMGQHTKVFQKEKLDGLTVEDGIIWDRFDTSLEARFAEAGVSRCFCSETGRGNFQQRVNANVALLKEATALVR